MDTKRVSVVVVALSLIIVAGCTKPTSSSTPRPTSRSGPAFGHSFNVIVAKHGSLYETSGYTDYEMNKSKWVAPGAVLVIGIEEGAIFGGNDFEYGDVIVVIGTDERPLFRLATQEDLIQLRSAVTVFGEEYSGVFTVPEGGNMLSE